jgi:amidase
MMLIIDSRWVGYSKVWNILDYTALAFPVTKVSQTLDPFPAGSYQPRNDQDAWNWGVYDPESMDGHPVGLQIVGRKLEEEKVLGVAAVFEKLLR